MDSEKTSVDLSRSRAMIFKQTSSSLDLVICVEGQTSSSPMFVLDQGIEMIHIRHRSNTTRACLSSSAPDIGVFTEIYDEKTTGVSSDVLS